MTFFRAPWYSNRIVFLVLFVCFSVVIAITYGLIPNYYLAALGATLLAIGNGDSLARSGLFGYAQNTGYPFGTPIVFGLPLSLVQATISLIAGSTATQAYILALIMFLLAAFLGCYLLLRHLKVQSVVALIFSFVFLSMNFLWGHLGYGALPFSFALLPLFMMVDKLLFDYLDHVPRLARWQTLPIVGGYIALKVFSLFLEGYTFVMWEVISGLFLVFYGVRLMRRRNAGRVALGVAILGLGTGIAYFTYGNYIPAGTQYDVMSADFFRGQGVDLTTLFMPYRNGTLITYLFGVGNSYSDPLAYYSDGSNILWNFLGVVLPLCAIGFLFVRKTLNAFLVALAASLVIGFFLSLGPSIKINALRPSSSNEGPITFEDYLMPPEAASFNLGTDALFTSIPGLNNMRATYRWLLIPKTVMIIFAALFLSRLIDSGHGRLALLIVVLLVIEMIPPLPELDRISKLNEQTREFIDRDLVETLKSHIQPREYLLFLSPPPQNDFLANYIVPPLDAVSYNVGGDKNFVLARAHDPEEVLNIWQFVDVNENVYGLMQRGLLDWLVIPYFSLRWDSYKWPPSENQRLTSKDSLLAVFDTTDSRFEYIEEKYYMLVKLR